MDSRRLGRRVNTSPSDSASQPITESPDTSTLSLRNSWPFDGELLAPRQTTKLEDHPLSTVPDCLINISATAFQIWRPSKRGCPLRSERSTTRHRRLSASQTARLDLLLRPVQRHHRAHYVMISGAGWADRKCCLSVSTARPLHAATFMDIMLVL